MKTVTFIILPFFFIFGLRINAQEVISSGGDYFSNASGSLSITVGEPVTESFVGENHILTQGFQQSRMIVVSLEETPDVKMEIMVYPNPASYLIKVRVEKAAKEKLHYSLFNPDGKLIMHGRLENTETEIQLAQLPSTTYLLKIYLNKDELKSFRIIRK